MRIFLVLLIFHFSLPVAAQYQELDKQLSKALKTWDQGENTEAYQMLSEVIRQRPYFAEPYYLRALVLESMFQLEDALTDLNILLELNPQHVEGIFLRGQVRNRMAQYELARKDFENLLNRPAGEAVTVIYERPKPLSAISRAAFLEGNQQDVLYQQLALAHMGLNRPDTAIEWLNKALNISPGNIGYLLDRGKAYRQLGESYKAESDFRQALGQNPYHPIGNQLLIDLLKENSRFESAEEFYNAAITGKPDFVLPFQQRGYQRMLVGRWADALADFNHVLHLKPDDTDAWVYCGMNQLRLGSHQEAIQSFEKALQLNPAHRLALFGIGNIHFQARQYQEAIAAYSLTAFYHPHFAEAFFQRGYAYYHLGSTQSGCQDFQRAADRGLEAAVNAWNLICRD